MVTNLASLFQNTASVSWTGAFLGILFHLAVQSVEFELYVFHFMAFSVVSLLSLTYLFVHFGRYGVLAAATNTSLFASSFGAALFVSITVYRLFFHRCRAFPGPFGAKVTRFYTMYLSAKEIKYYKELEKMHSKYGDFVRTGPREITVLRKSAVSLLYGPNSSTLKSTWYGHNGNDQKKTSIHLTRDRYFHRLRRRAWDRGFSIKALATYEARIKKKADAFVHQLYQLSGPVDATAWSMFFSFDVMGEVGFEKNFNNLATGVEHPAIKAIHNHMSILGVLSTVPWLLNIVSSIPGATAGYTDFFQFCSDELRKKDQTWDSEKYPQDIISWLLKAVKEKDVSASPSVEALEDDARVVIIAGSETTATTLAGALFYLAENQEKQAKLHRMLNKTIPNYSQWTYAKVKNVTYLDDWINETLRLRPAIISGGQRVTAINGVQIDEVFIPGDTNVIVPTQLIHRDPRWWPQGSEFIPERFGERREEMGTNQAPYFPFSLGAYNCPGKKLAQLSLRIALSAIVQNFEVSFPPGEDGKKFVEETLDTFTTSLPSLHLKFTPRC